MLFAVYHKKSVRLQQGLFCVVVFWRQQTAEMLSAEVLEDIQTISAASASLFNNLWLILLFLLPKLHHLIFYTDQFISKPV